jgi:hypothetical protein
MEENHAPWIGVGALVIAWALLSILQIITKRNQANLIKSFHQIIKCKTKILNFSVPMTWLTTPSLSGNKFSGFCSKLQSLNPSHCKKIATFPLFISLLTTFKLFKPSKFFFFYFLLSVVLLCLKFLKNYSKHLPFVLCLSLPINSLWWLLDLKLLRAKPHFLFIAFLESNCFLVIKVWVLSWKLIFLLLFFFITCKYLSFIGIVMGFQLFPCNCYCHKDFFSILLIWEFEFLI